MSEAQTSLLDNIRISNGPVCLRNYYTDIVTNNPQRALELLNDPGLSFSTLFVLRYDLKELTSSRAFNPLYYTALKLTDQLSGSKDIQTEADIRSGGSNTRTALNWMIQTGYRDEGLGKSYDTLMDNIAALLAKSFKDTLALPDIIDLAFMRHRAGKEIHDLIWAFFEACSPESLYYIVNRLNSSYSADRALARKLLHFIPSVSEGRMYDAEEGRIDNAAVYSSAWRWLYDNLPFLYYSGESLNLSPLPEYYIISLPCKYLCHTISTKTGQPLQALSSVEQRLLMTFSSLPRHLQEELSDFSCKLLRTNPYKWSMWLTLPITRQIAIAVPELEVTE